MVLVRLTLKPLPVLFIVSPTQKSGLPQLIVRGKFRVFYLADEFGPYPLDLFLDVRWIHERAFVDEERLHSIDRMLQSFSAKAAARIAVMAKFTSRIGAEDDRT